MDAMIIAAISPGGVVPIDADTTTKLVTEIIRLRAALSEIADGDAFYDGPAKFMEIASRALMGNKR